MKDNNNLHKNHFYHYTKNGHRYVHLPDNWTNKIANSNKAYWLMVLIITVAFLFFIFVMHILAMHGIYIYHHGQSLGDPAKISSHPITIWTLISFAFGWLCTQGTKIQTERETSTRQHRKNSYKSFANDLYYDLYIAPFAWLAFIFIFEFESNGASLAKNIGLGIFPTNIRMIIYAILSLIIGAIIGSIINHVKH